MLNQIAAIHGTGVAASTNSYESIATVTVGAGGASNVEFTSIPSTYKHLQIRGISRNDSTTYFSDDVFLLVGNGSIDTGSNYSFHRLYGTGSSATADSNTSVAYMDIGQSSTNKATSGMFGASVIDILEYANTNINKTVRALTGVDLNGNTDGRIMLTSGNWRSTSAINAIRLKPPSGNFVQYSTFALYGIKG